MTDVPDHFCPACGATRKAFLRYPWHLCNDCRKRAVDGAGRALEFANESLSGGFMFRYAGEDDDGWRPCLAVIALVDARPVRIAEARFGGIVAEPVPNRPHADADRICDLTRKGIGTQPLPPRQRR